jgi:8-oxo-dGTP pyrophosphatase MutT (NUDIX family)
MIVMEAGPSRFQLRAGAIIRSNGHILIHRATHDPFWALPGGRVEFHESSSETLAREIQEELGRSATIGPLRFIIENFFELGGRNFHEVGFCYEADLAEALPFHETEVVHRSQDGSVSLEFRWVLPQKAALDAFDFKPASLRGMFDHANGVMHLVHRDGS